MGPAVGGLLTELVSWQSIFLVQVPAAILLAVPIIGVARGEATPGWARCRRAPTPGGQRRLGLISAALAAALFLVVLMLIEGWRLSLIAAAAAVSVLPARALLSARSPASPRGRGAGGGGRDPDRGRSRGARAVRTRRSCSFPPQALVGVGLALTLSALTEAALAGARRRRSTAAGRSLRTMPA
jgi:hypothetical protein